MTPEEKAKAYDEALEKAKFYHGNCPSEPERKKLEKMFPVLRESEDERLRELIIDRVRSAAQMTDGLRELLLTYLEKQKESLHISESCKENAESFTSEQKPAELTPLGTLLSNYLKNDFEYFATKKWDEKKWNEVMNIQASELLRTAKNELEKEQTAEWSEEDKEMLDAMIDMVSNSLYEPLCPRDKMLSFLKSLRPSWKPSEEQMEALLWCVAHLGGADRRVLAELYEHLKKL